MAWILGADFPSKGSGKPCRGLQVREGGLRPCGGNYTMLRSFLETKAALAGPRLWDCLLSSKPSQEGEQGKERVEP